MAAEGKTAALSVILVPVDTVTADGVKVTELAVLPDVLDWLLLAEDTVPLVPQPVRLASVPRPIMRNAARRSSGGSQSCGSNPSS